MKQRARDLISIELNTIVTVPVHLPEFQIFVLLLKERYLKPDLQFSVLVCCL